MSIINRRNALLGWAAWTVTKQVAKQKARRQVGAAGGARRIVMPAAVAAAAATILGAVFFWRRHSRPAGLGEVAQ
jgi:hypothetical protein